ncbi:hypothetical protein ENBRE01_1908 [Enteropsectra breve]|nr:hypothetical protein ENBRE01_1908 [Enteropsectra breve]
MELHFGRRMDGFLNLFPETSSVDKETSLATHTLLIPTMCIVGLYIITSLLQVALFHLKASLRRNTNTHARPQSYYKRFVAWAYLIFPVLGKNTILLIAVNMLKFYERNNKTSLSYLIFSNIVIYSIIYSTMMQLLKLIRYHICEIKPLAIIRQRAEILLDVLVLSILAVYTGTFYHVIYGAWIWMSLRSVFRAFLARRRCGTPQELAAFVALRKFGTQATQLVSGDLTKEGHSALEALLNSKGYDLSNVYIYDDGLNSISLFHIKNKNTGCFLASRTLIEYYKENPKMLAGIFLREMENGVLNDSTVGGGLALAKVFVFTVAFALGLLVPYSGAILNYLFVYIFLSDISIIYNILKLSVFNYRDSYANKRLQNTEYLDEFVAHQEEVEDFLNINSFGQRYDFSIASCELFSVPGDRKNMVSSRSPMKNSRSNLNIAF